jgi:hypothetical protein
MGVGQLLSHRGDAVPQGICTGTLRIDRSLGAVGADFGIRRPGLGRF